MKEAIKRFVNFLIDNIKRPGTFLNRQVRKFHLIGKGFVEDKCLLRSSALAYTTLLSIVPLFAAILLVIKGFGTGGEEEAIVRTVQEFVEKIIPPGVILSGKESLAHLIATKYYEFAERMSASRVGSIGVAFLIVTVVSLLITVEKSMNDIWGVKRHRSFINRIVIYWAILTLTPILLLPALSTGFISQSQSVVDWLASFVPFEWFAGLIQSNLLPFVFMTIAFTLFYIIMPNTKVRFKSAFIAAVIASFIFNLVVGSFGYVMVLTGKAAAFKFVYGALALVPLLLMFVYITWVITLFCAEVAFADQNATTYYMEQEAANANIVSRERLALRLVAEIAKGFGEGGGVLSAVQLQDRLNLPIRIINEVLDTLEKAGILVCIEERNMIYHPARTLDKITVGNILDAIRRYGNDLELPSDETEKSIDGVFGALIKSGDEIGNVTIDKLVLL